MLKLQFKDRRQEPVWLVDNIFSIGRDASNSLMIADESISLCHAEINSTGDDLSITDRSHDHSLWINGEHAHGSRKLQAGDLIKLGKVELEVIDPHAGEAIPGQTSVSQEALWKLKSNASWLEQNQISIHDGMIIGRESSCDLCLPLDHLSRQHVELNIKGGKLFVRDMESSNGTYLNGKKITEAWAKNGDKLKLDVVTFEIQGPDHDPDRTIVRQIPTTNKKTAAAKARQAKPRKASSENSSNEAKKPVSPTPSTKRDARLPTRKPLAANGKQDWIKSNTHQQLQQKTGNSKWIAFGAIVVAAIIAAFIFV